MAANAPDVAQVSLEHSASAPIVLYGAPGSVRGSVRLRNVSEDKARLTGLDVSVPGLEGPAGQPIRRAQLRARLMPGQQARVTAALALDPGTKPGRYEGVARHAGREYPVQVLVVEHVDFRLGPRAVFLHAAGERSFTRQFVAENAGNVPIALDEVCLVPLRDVAETRGALLRAAEQRDADDVVGTCLRAWLDRQVGPLAIRREPLTLRPGEVRTLDVSFELPENIQPGRRYVADLQVYTAPVRVEITTSGREKRAS